MLNINKILDYPVDKTIQHMVNDYKRAKSKESRWCYAIYNTRYNTKGKTLDLLNYLQNYEPNELVHLGGKDYCTKTHDSLKISNGI